MFNNIQDFFKRVSSRYLKAVPATTRRQAAGGVGFGSKGLSPGIEVGSDPLAIYRVNVSKAIPKDKAMVAYTGWVFACVKAIADEMANMKFRLYQITGDGKQEEVLDHDLLDLLDSVNDHQTGPELKHMMASHLELTGNCFILLGGVKDEKSKPKTMHVLNPAFVKVILDKRMFPYTVTGYEFRVDSKKYLYQPYEIVHLKYPDPNDAYEGIGTVQAIAPWIDIDNYATEFNRKFFLNGAMIGGFLESEATSEAQINSLRLSFDSNHGGVENAHKTGVLPKGVKYTPNQSSHKDMDFGALMDNTMDKILAGFRVSRTILGTAESDTNRATAETADYIFARRTIKPKMDLICSYLNEFLTYRYGDNIYISFTDPTPEDKAFRIQEMQAVLANQPAMSADEAREKYLGLPAVENGEYVMVPTTFMPLGKPKEDKPTPKKDAERSVVKTRFMKNAERRRSAASSMAEVIANEMKKTKDIRAKKMKGLTPEEYHEVWKAFASRVDVYEQRTMKIIRSLNEEQKKEVLERLPKIYSRETMKAVKRQDLFDLKGWVSTMSDALTPVMTELYGKEGEAAADQIGFTGIDLLKDPNIKQSIKTSIDLLSESYNETTLDQLTEKLNDIIASGATLDEATSMVNDIYAFSDLTRASQVARTETFRIANDATKAGWKETGTVKTIKWYTATDDGVCPFCDAERGKVISIDDNFYDVGDKITLESGQSLNLDYSDVGAPPLHVNCRCYISPEEISLE